MSKRLRHIISLIVVSCLMFSSVGYTTILFACPSMSVEAGRPCSGCKNGITPKKHDKDCCKPKIERTVLKADFEKPTEVKSSILPMVILPTVLYEFSFLFETSSSLHFQTSLPFAASTINSVEKCVLFSTFLI
jgi:hypothetical protein